MKVNLHIGLERSATTVIQSQLAHNRARLSDSGILYPESPGSQNHVRLFMAVSDPDAVCNLRANRGFASPARQRQLREALQDKLAQELSSTKPDVLLLSALQLGTCLHRESELVRLKDLLSPFASEFKIIAHVSDPAHMLRNHYAEQVLEGRAASLARDLDLVGEKDWRAACLATWHQMTPALGQYSEVQGAPFWLDFPALAAQWQSVFGQDAVEFHRGLGARTLNAEVRQNLCRPLIGNLDLIDTDPALPDLPSAAWLTRARQINTQLLQISAQRKEAIPRKDWRALLGKVSVAGDAMDTHGLTVISKTFHSANLAFAQAHNTLPAETFDYTDSTRPWQEADQTKGFRPTPYVMAFLDRITPKQPLKQIEISEQTRALMPPLAQKNHAHLQGTPLKPHNKLGTVDETKAAPQYTVMPTRKFPSEKSGRVIVGCMKNEAPYILEWIAHHRSIGVDNFLIYTNDCTDGTDQLLDQLQHLGIVQHRRNDNWKGNSPQQYALNQSLKEPLIKNAEWIIHIDVDEFINVRCGNGTLDDFFDQTPDATHVAMTWRLFGHNDVKSLNNEFVTQQFDHCAPKFCPKPHTVWGFKTMTKNIGAYEKISCHRPNKLIEEKRNQIKWVNGSGRDMTHEVINKGWRNSRKSIGYDLLQLNHYALRSAESFLIKRQRGRALHVDRSIGLNYWIRMDWNDHQDITIQRNQARLTAEFDALIADPTVQDLHQAGRQWHAKKAAELQDTPEFSKLYKQIQKIKLTSLERASYALALDMES